MLLPLALLLGLVSLACAVVVLRHAFQRSVGTGVMALLIPFYVFVYAFRQFEHPWKGPVLAAWASTLVLSGVFYAAAVA